MHIPQFRSITVFRPLLHGGLGARPEHSPPGTRALRYEGVGTIWKVVGGAAVQYEDASFGVY